MLKLATYPLRILCRALTVFDASLTINPMSTRQLSIGDFAALPHHSGRHPSQRHASASSEQTIIAKCFDVTPDETALIESALAPTRSPKPARKRAAV